MKKKVVSLLVAAMTVASLTACGNSGSDAPAANQEPAPAEKQEAEPAPAESQAEAPAESQAEAGSRRRNHQCGICTGWS